MSRQWKPLSRYLTFPGSQHKTCFLRSISVVFQTWSAWATCQFLSKAFLFKDQSKWSAMLTLLQHDNILLSDMCGTSTKKLSGCRHTSSHLLSPISSTESLRWEFHFKTNHPKISFQPSENGVEFRIWSREVRRSRDSLYSVSSGWLRPNWMGLPDRSPDPLVLRGLLQHLVPSAQAGHDCNPGLHIWGDGTLGPHHVKSGKALTD